MLKFYAGFDGGGSSTRCCIVTPEGEIAGRGRGGASNYLFCGRDTALQSLRDAISGALVGIEGDIEIAGVFVASAAVEVYSGAGQSGFFADAIRGAVNSRVAVDCGAVVCDSDVLPVWYAAGHGDTAAVTIAGTGAVSYVITPSDFIRTCIHKRLSSV